MNCERCGREAGATTMSIFNTETICVGGEDSCSSKERRHPAFAAARDAEEAAVRAGNYNFPGVGKPSDL